MFQGKGVSKQALEGRAAEAIVKGDAKCTAIAAASIVAKVFPVLPLAASQTLTSCRGPGPHEILSPVTRRPHSGRR